MEPRNIIGEKRSEYNKLYYLKNKKKIRKYEKDRRKNKPLVRMSHNLNRRIVYWIKKGYSDSNEVYNILGIAHSDFKKYIESKFMKGMNWENYGIIWHFDHRIPTSKAKNKIELIQLYYYTNYQPLLSKDNLKKGNRI